MPVNVPEGFLCGFAEPGSTQTADTVITQGIKPAGAYQSPPLVYGLFANRPNWYRSGRTHITGLIYTTSTTAHSVRIMRPLNWAKINGAVAKNTAVIALTDDPGVYSTNYKYPLPAGATVEGNVANNAIAANDWVAFQLLDGTWRFDKVSSGTYAALTMTTTLPNVTGGGIADGQILFFFGAVTDVDPATGVAHHTITTVVSTSNVNLLGDSQAGCFSALHGGDPLLVISSNATAAGTLGGITGYYGRN